VIGSLLLGDFHVHSTFSDDAVSTVAENIAAASAAGLQELRLVEHVRESTTWVPDFLHAVADEIVPDGLMVFTGVETKLMDSTGRLDLPAGYRGAVLIADHQFPGTDGPWSPRSTVERLRDGLATMDALDLLVSALVGAMTSIADRSDGPGGQLAHCFSILPKIGLSEADLTVEHLSVWARAAATTETVVEVNEKWACPSPRSLEAARAAGVTLVASTDSHIASDVGRYDVVKRLLAAVSA
jgi:putative hydrolase